MVSDSSSKVGLPPGRFQQLSSSPMLGSSSISRASLPPTIGRVRVSQSVGRDYDVTSSYSGRQRFDDASNRQQHHARSRGTSPAATGLTSVSSFATTTTSSTSSVLPSAYRRRFSLSAKLSDGVGDQSVLDHHTVRAIDDELDFDRRRSTASMVRWARRNDVIYTADGARSIGSTGQIPTAAIRSRSRSNSRRRELSVDQSDYYQDISSPADDDDSIRRRTRPSLTRSRSRAMSLPRFETVSSVSASGAQSHLNNRQQFSTIRSPSVDRRYSTSAVRSTSVTQSASGIYSASPQVGTSSAGARSPSAYFIDFPRRGSTTDGGKDWDLTAFVLHPGEKFVPTDVSISVLPSGQKAVTYTRFAQSGHGDQSSANVEIERVIQRTKRMQENMHTLENFVKRNRSLFPEDIIIYQHIVFYLLDAAELKRLGIKPDSEVYGVKVRERLVAPYGTDVASVLKRYYSRHTEVEIEYLETEDIRRRLREEMAQGGNEEDSSSRRRRRYKTDIEETTETEIEYLRRNLNKKQPSTDKRRESIDRRLQIEEEEAIKRRNKQAEAAPPQFTTKLQPKRVLVGDTVRLNCAVTGNPHPVVTWYRGNHQIFDNDRYYINNTFGLCSLKILDARKDDAGVYTARAVNDVGEMSSCAEVLIDVHEEMRVSREEATRKPWFLIDLQSASAYVGQRAVLEGQAAGRPVPKFRWQKDNVDIDFDLRVRQVSDDFGNVKLVIRDVKTSDAGVYTCIAENNEGRAKCTAALRVFNHPGGDTLPLDQNGYDWDLRDSSPRDRQVADDRQLPYRGGRKPTFTELPPSRIEITEGDPLTLRCAVDGDPRPVVTWFKGVRELTYSERHRVLAETDSRYMMQVKWTLQTDPGEYSVVATNSFGHASFTVHVNILPRAPEEAEFNGDKSHPALREYELIKKMKQGKMPPVFIRKLPLEKTIKVGQTLVIKCCVTEAKMTEHLAGIDIVVKDRAVSSRELPDFVVTPAYEDIQTTPVNGEDSDAVSVTVLKNVVHITDDQLKEHSEPDVTSLNGASDVPNQPFDGFADVNAADKGEKPLHVDETPSVEASLTTAETAAEGDRTISTTETIRDIQEVPNESLPSNEGDASVPPDVTDAFKPSSDPPAAADEEIKEKETSERQDASELIVSKEPHAKNHEDDIPSTQTIAAEKTENTDPQVVTHKTVEIPIIQVDVPWEEETTVQSESIVMSQAEDRADNQSREVCTAEETKTETSQSADPISQPDPAIPTDNSAATAPGESEKKVRTRKSKKTDSILGNEDDPVDEEKKSKKRSSKPKKVKKKESDVEEAADRLSDVEKQEDELGEAPTFIRELQDLDSLEGSTVSFQCEASARPTANVTWYHGDDELANGQRAGRLSIQSDELSGLYSINISNVLSSDAGIYHVQLSNKHGKSRSTAKLAVKPVVVDFKADEESSEESSGEDASDQDE